MLRFKHTMERERAFERQHIGKQRQIYLDTDVLIKLADDDGYRRKVNLIERALAGNPVGLSMWEPEPAARTNTWPRKVYGLYAPI